MHEYLTYPTTVSATVSAIVYYLQNNVIIWGLHEPPKPPPWIRPCMALVLGTS